MKRKAFSSGIAWSRVLGSALLYLCFAAVLLWFFIGLGLKNAARDDAKTDVLITPASTPPPASTPVPTPTASPVPTPTPDGLSVSDPAVHTVAWLSDTQHYASEFPRVFTAMTRFLSDNRARMNLVYIVHTGDFVDDRDDPAQWENALGSMEYLSGIPYGVLAGNHDIGTSVQDFTQYAQRFGKKAMEARSGSDAYYGGSYQNNRGHYDLVDIGENRFVFAYMSYAPDSDALSWLNKVFRKHGDRIGILCVHDYFKTDMSYSDSGEALFKNVVKKNPNLYLVLCGHRYTVGMKTAEFGSRQVYELISNYQAAGDEGGNGYLQFLQFDDRKKELRVLSYSPYKDDRRYYDTPGAELEKYPVDPDNEEYAFPYPWA